MMKLYGEDEYREIIENWSLLQVLANVSPPVLRHKLKVIDRKGLQVQFTDIYTIYKHPRKNMLAFYINKNHWAKGRKMKIESELDCLASGEYVIVWKAETNSYDQQDFLIVEKVTPKLETARQSLNWLEKQIAELEAKDGKTTEMLVKEMNVRGY